MKTMKIGTGGSIPHNGFMKLLVLAQTPPPMHGQSIMVQTLVEGLGQVAGEACEGKPRIEVHHVNLALSRDAGDIGRARVAKIFTLLSACVRTLWMRVRIGGRVTLYYVPAPAKRAALYRDWMAMCLLRPFFTNLVLHWHASGLGEWLATKATAPERWLTRLFLDRAALSIVLAPELASDAQVLRPRKISVVANGLDVTACGENSKSQNPKSQINPEIPNPKFQKADIPNQNPGGSGNLRCELLYLGACTREKGIFAALDALSILERENPGEYSLTIAGAFADLAEERVFHERIADDDALRRRVHYSGPADSARKHALYAAAGIFVFPTHYAHEAQPLVLIEALAHDLPIVTTRWRAIPGMLPRNAHVQLANPGATPRQLADAIRAAHAAGPANGTLRAHYEAHFTREAHLLALARALLEI